MSSVEIGVEGMTCQHCVSAVTTQIKGISGVTEVTISLDPEGVSRVSVEGDAEVSPEQLKAAVEEAGYHMVDGPSVP